MNQTCLNNTTQVPKLEPEEGRFPDALGSQISVLYKSDFSIRVKVVIGPLNNKRTKLDFLDVFGLFGKYVSKATCQLHSWIPVPFDTFGHRCRTNPRLDPLVRYLQQTKSGPVWFRVDLSPHDKKMFMLTIVSMI